MIHNNFKKQGILKINKIIIKTSQDKTASTHAIK
jgi:hypothetical protein